MSGRVRALPSSRCGPPPWPSRDRSCSPCPHGSRELDRRRCARGVAAQGLRPGTFPPRMPGTVLAGVLGAAFGGFLAAAALERRIAELDSMTLAAALVGSVAVVGVESNGSG